MEKQANTLTTKTGTIYQAISGFYYVWADGVSYATKPRGNFRHQQVKPLVGDNVTFEIDLEDTTSQGRIIDILPRKNQLIRPAVVNVDYALIVMSLVEPEFSYNLLDNFLVSVELYQIEPIIILTKYDLLLKQVSQTQANARIQAIQSLYKKVGYRCLVLDDEAVRLAEIKQLIQRGIYVVMGQSGVGKSTLLNKLLPQANIETGAISDYLNRGRHTTREVTLYQLGAGLLADTPGFSALEFETIDKEELAQYFPEIWRASEQCRFRSCLHQQEPGCHVKSEVAAGNLAESRYNNYSQLLTKIAQRKPMYHKRNPK